MKNTVRETALTSLEEAAAREEAKRTRAALIASFDAALRRAEATGTMPFTAAVAAGWLLRNTTSVAEAREQLDAVNRLLVIVDDEEDDGDFASTTEIAS